MRKSFFFDVDNLVQKPELLAFLETTLGKITVLLTFAMVLAVFSVPWWPVHSVLSFQWWPMVMAALALMTFLPQYRRLWLGLFSVLGMFCLPWFHWPAVTGSSSIAPIFFIISAILFCIAYVFLAKRHQRSWLMRYPIFNLIIIIFVLMLLASYCLPGSAKIIIIRLKIG